jgi:hypothetical protein
MAQIKKSDHRQNFSAALHLYFIARNQTQNSGFPNLRIQGKIPTAKYDCAEVSGRLMSMVT